MSNLLQDGATWLADRMKEAAGRQVTLQFYEGEITLGADGLPLKGVVTEKVYEVVDEQDFAQMVVSYDWDFKTVDLVFNGQPVIPERGTKIIETLNGVAYVYEGMTLGRKPATEWKDTSGIISVVHTKRVEAGP